MKTLKVISRSRKLVLTINTMTLLTFALMTNASADGFRLVKDINPGHDSSGIEYMSGDKNLFFWAIDADGADRESWTIDSAHGGVIKISDIDYDVYNHMTGKADLSVGTHQFFTLRRESDWGYELWTGTSSGVEKLKDIPDYVTDAQTVSALGKYFFVPFSDPDYGRELWVSDGTTTGTYMVKDINIGTGSSNPHELMEAGGELYFMVGDNLWESDGIDNNTRLARSFECDTCTSSAHLMAVVNTTLYVRWSKYIDGATNYELWRYETDSGQTSKVGTFPNLSDKTSNYAGVGNMLYFLNTTDLDSSSYKYGLWKTDGTSVGTVLLKEWDGYDWYTSGLLTPAENLLYFHGGDNDNRELWVSNGTSQGTYEVKDLSGSADTGSELSCLTACGSTLFFTRSLPYSTGGYLWMSNSTESGTIKTDFRVSILVCPIVVNGHFYFYGNDHTNNYYGGELYTQGSGGALPSVIMYLLN